MNGHINQGDIMIRYELGTMRTFTTQNFMVIADAIEEDSPDFSFDETGETQRKVCTGELLCFAARVRVLFHGHEIGSDYLGNCIYRSLDEFMDHKECGKQNREWKAQGKHGRCGSYFHDMIREAIASARKELRKFNTVKVRC